jgi:hypothetical protein
VTHACCPHTQVQEKEDARQTYDDALASGHGTVLVEQVRRAPIQGLGIRFILMA